jgi:phosphodiesterase/alkaline phosphatase D-like protein
MEHNRRRFLASIAGVAGLAAMSTIPATEALGAPERLPGEDIFKLGVASGDFTATGVVLWTRLVPLSFEPGGGMPGRPVTVSQPLHRRLGAPRVEPGRGAGDWHSNFVNDIKRDFDRPESPVVATEFVGTSISSNGDGEVYGPYYGPMIKFNPHIRFFDGDRRGYISCRVSRAEMRADLRVVSTVSRPDAPESTFAAFVVESGRPGAQPN